MNQSRNGLPCNISTTSARVSSGVPNIEKQMKARGRRPSAFIVSRCLEPLMKSEARVFDMASQSIFCCIVGIYYCIVLFTKLVCKLFKVGPVVIFFWKSFSHVLVKDGCKNS